jgi:hypothetical protein
MINDSSSSLAFGLVERLFCPDVFLRFQPLLEKEIHFSLQCQVRSVLNGHIEEFGNAKPGHVGALEIQHCRNVPI